MSSPFAPFLPSIDSTTFSPSHSNAPLTIPPSEPTSARSSSDLDPTAVDIEKAPFPEKHADLTSTDDFPYRDNDDDRYIYESYAHQQYGYCSRSRRIGRRRGGSGVLRGLMKLLVIVAGIVASVTVFKTLVEIYFVMGGLVGVWNGLMQLRGEVTITFSEDSAFQIALLLITLLVSTFVVVTWSVWSLIFRELSGW